MFSLEQRIKNTNFIVNHTHKTLYKITKNNKLSGFLVVILHWFIIGIPLLYLLFGKVNTLYYILSCLVYVVYMLQLYFKGCILARIERDLFETTEWWGPWIVLFKPMECIGIQMHTSLANKIINTGILVLTVVIICKTIIQK
jgi:hypothetical protein